MDFLSKELVAGFTGTQVLVGAVVAVALVWALKTLFGGKKEEPSHHVSARCSCGWSGTVSKYARRCPKCNQAVQPDDGQGR